MTSHDRRRNDMMNLTVAKHAVKAVGIFASSMVVTTIVGNVMGKKFGEEIILAYEASKKEEEAK